MTSLLSAYGNDWNNTYAKTKVLEQKDTDANNTQMSPTAPPKSLKRPIPPVFWLHKVAWGYYPMVVKVLGEAGEIETCAGGLARWLSTKDSKLFGMRNVFLKHELRDQNIFVKCPTPHYEFFYSFIKYPVKYENVNKIINMSPSLTYDPTRSELVARSGNIGTNIALLYLAVTINEGNLSTTEINSKGLYAKILELSDKASHLVYLYKELTKMLPQHTEPTNSEIVQSRFYTHDPPGASSF